jgi:pyruvate kinase
MKKTKIICTVGPSTDNVELLEKMLRAGMDLARFNFSHGSHEDHGKRLAMVREAAAKAGKVVATIADTKGPEMRLGMFANNKVTLREGDEFVLTTEDILGDEHIAHVNYSNLPREVEVGKMILLSDGLLSLEVTAIEDNEYDNFKVMGINAQKVRDGYQGNIKIYFPNMQQTITDNFRYRGNDLVSNCEFGINYPQDIENQLSEYVENYLSNKR